MKTRFQAEKGRKGYPMVLHTNQGLCTSGRDYNHKHLCTQTEESTKHKAVANGTSKKTSALTK